MIGRMKSDLDPMTGRWKNDLDPMTRETKTDWHPKRKSSLLWGGGYFSFQTGKIVYLYAYLCYSELGQAEPEFLQFI